MSKEQVQPFTYNGWGILELMGRRRRAGWIRTAVIGDQAVLVVTVPATSGNGDAMTEIYAVGALYCLTPTTEVVARQAAQATRIECQRFIDGNAGAPVFESAHDPSCRTSGELVRRTHFSVVRSGRPDRAGALGSGDVPF